MIFRWGDGRLSGSYKKLKLLHTIWFDTYLIKFYRGYHLPIHIDPIRGYKHYRLNILLKGEDAYIGEYIFKWGRIIVFEASLPHGTTTLSKDRLLLSIGWKRKDE